jgi:hypothetical protein
MSDTNEGAPHAVELVVKGVDRCNLAHEDSDPDASRQVVPTDIYGKPLTGVGLPNYVGLGKH